MKIGEGRGQQPSLPPAALQLRMRHAASQSALKAATCALPVEGAIRCTVPGCSCECFSPGKSNVRYCDGCSHSWVPHALDKLGPRQQAPALSVEPVQANAAFDIASLVLYGCQALPIRLKILLDRLFSVLRRDEVLHVLAGFGWTHEDYARGYILQEMLSSASESWTICSAEEEPLVLQQFLRFGETRAVALELLQQCNNNNNNNSSTNNHNKSGAAAPPPRQQNTPDGQRRCSPPPPPPPPPPPLLKTPPAAFRLPPPLPLPPPPPCTVAAAARPPSQTQVVRPVDFRLLGGLPSHFPPTTAPSSGFINFSLANLCLPKMNSAADVLSPTSHHKQEHPPPMMLQQVRPSLKLANTGDHDRKFASDENSQSALNLSRDVAVPEASPKPPPAVTAATLGAAKRPWSAAAGPLSLVTQLVNPATGKKRVQCSVCLKTFCDKGALKIHFSAVHLREMHKCTVDGCNMMFSSRRSRNRHSANPNPKLHSPHYRRKMSPHDGRSALARTPPTLVGPPGLPFPLLAAFPHTNPGFDLNASRFEEMRRSDLTNNNTVSSEDMPLSLSSNHQESDDDLDDDDDDDDDDDINISVDGELLEAAREGDRGGDVGDGRALDLSDSDSSSSTTNGRPKHDEDGCLATAIDQRERSPASSVGERKWPYPMASSTPEMAADMETESVHDGDREEQKSSRLEIDTGNPDEAERMDVAEALPLVMKKVAKDEPMTRESKTENSVQSNDQVQSGDKQWEEEDGVSEQGAQGESLARERSSGECNGSTEDDARMKGPGSPRLSSSPVQSSDALKHLESISNGPTTQPAYRDSPSPERSPASSSNEYHSDDGHCFFVDSSGAFTAGEVPIDKENPRRCTACGKVFQNHFGVKTHYQNVHLKLMHRCTVDGCNAAFPSKRSRDRHSANANLHRKLLSTSSSSRSPSPSPPEPQEAMLPAAAFHSQLIARLYAESQTLEAVLKSRAMAEHLQQQQQQQLQQQQNLSHHQDHHHQHQQQTSLLLPPLSFPDLTNLLRARVNGQTSETSNEASFDLPRP